jgi:hypothetical protein
MAVVTHDMTQDMETRLIEVTWEWCGRGRTDRSGRGDGMERGRGAMKERGGGGTQEE